MLKLFSILLNPTFSISHSLFRSINNNILEYTDIVDSFSDIFDILPL